MVCHPVPGIYWSLAVEEHFYLLFPWLYLAMQKRRLPRLGQACLMWGLCALILIWRYVIADFIHPSTGFYLVTTDTRADVIFFGCALAVWNNPVLDEATGSPRVWKYLQLPSALIALGLSLGLANAAFVQTWYFTIQGIALTLVFIAAVRFYDWLPFRVLNFGPVAFIGVLSYSLYLVHDVLLRAVAQTLPDLKPGLRTLLALAASGAAALVIYLVVERPCARLRRRLAG
jgi:peptidoglycan/LPS O-acetylase OafA/YrhL